MNVTYAPMKTPVYSSHTDEMVKLDDQQAWSGWNSQKFRLSLSLKQT